MNSAHAFAYAMSGSFTDQQIAQNAAYVNQNVAAVQAAGGWLAGQATKILDGFNNFLNSRAWEFGRRLAAQSENGYVGRFDIGFIGSAEGILGAQGLMANYIMANPRHMQAMLDGLIDNYKDLASTCTGVGIANPFYRKAMNGIMDLQMVDGKAKLSHSHFFDTGGTQLSFTDLDSIHRTWSASDIHRAKGLFDVKRDEDDVVSEQ